MLSYSPQESYHPSSSSSIWCSHWHPWGWCADAMYTFSFNITWKGILPLLPVDKNYIILNCNPPPRLHSSLGCEQHNSATWKNTSCVVQLSPWLTKHHMMKVYGTGGTVPYFIHPNTRQTWVNGFMAQMLYTKYQLNRRLGRPQSWSGCSREYRNLFILTEIEPRFLGHPAHSPVSNLTEPSHLPFRCYPVQITALLEERTAA